MFSVAALTEDGKFLLAARKCRRATCTDYIISLHADDMSKGSNTYIGKLRCVLTSYNMMSFFNSIMDLVFTVVFFFFLSPLIRSNFLGTKFTVYDAQPPHPGAKVMRNHSTRIAGLKQVSPRVPAGSYPVAHISYEVNVLGSR